MNAEDWLAERARIEQAATGAPWVWHSYGNGGQTLARPNHPFHEVNVLKTTDGWPPMHADAEFVAAARTALPKALDALEAVLALWPDADPCDRCVHVDCEVVRAITEALGVEP